MNARIVSRYFLPLIMLLFVLGCAKKESTVVISVGDQKMDVATFVRQFQMSSNYKNLSQFSAKDLKHFANEFLVDNLLFQAEGYARGYDQDSSIIMQIEQEKKRILTRGNGLLYQKIIPGKFPVTEEEIQNFYNHLDKKIKLAYILVKSKKLADSLYTVLQKGGNFSQLAYKFSMDTRTARKGGQVRNYMPWGFMGLALDSIAFKMEPGQISKPIKTIVGYHIIKLLDKKDRKREPLQNVRESIEQRIQRIKLDDFVQEYISGLYEKYNLHYDESLIPKILGIYSDKAGLPVLIDSKLKKSQLDKIFITFTGGKWTVQNFISVYNTTPRALRHRLKYKEDVVDFIYKAVSQDLMYEEAKRLGLDKKHEFIREAELAKNTIILQHLKDLLVYKRIEVKDAEVAAYYQANRKKFGNKSLNNARPQIIDQLRRGKIYKKSHEEANKLREKFAVEYNEKGLKKAAAELNKLKNSKS